MLSILFLFFVLFLFVLLVESFLSSVMRSHSCHGFLHNVGLCSHSYQFSF